MSTAGLILAAGESRRMGRPKALLEYGGSTFLDTLIGLFGEWCAPVVVVLGASAEEIRAGTQRPAVFVVNEDYQRGQTSSMQCGLRAVPGSADGVLFTLVDHPAVSAATVKALRGGACFSLSGSACPIRVPRHGGRRGHPIWFSSRLIPEFLSLDDSEAARDVVRAHAHETEFLDLDDPGVVADIDEPADYAALMGAAL